MKKYIITVLLFVCITDYVIGQNKESDNYKYSVVIDVNNMNNSDEYNYKYLINKSIIFNTDGTFKLLESRKVYFIQYKYSPVPDQIVYSREPVDTTMINLSDSQLEHIYRLTKDMFSLNSLPLDYKGNNRVQPDYDGEYALVSFELEDYSVVFNMEISFDEDMVFQTKYRKLLDFIESVKDSYK